MYTVIHGTTNIDYQLAFQGKPFGKLLVGQEAKARLQEIADMLNAAVEIGREDERRKQRDERAAMVPQCCLQS